MAVTWTKASSAGNALASQSLAAGASQSFNIDASTAYALRCQVSNTPGATVAATSGLLVTVKARVGTTPISDTIAGSGSFVIPSTASTLASQSFDRESGMYAVTLTNQDVTNAITVSATVDFLTGI
jgi:hypothetical protein